MEELDDEPEEPDDDEPEDPEEDEPDDEPEAGAASVFFGPPRESVR